MSRRKFSPEEKLVIVLAGLKENANIAEICRNHGISQTLFYRWKDAFLQGGKAFLDNRAGKKENKILQARIDQLEKTLGRKALEIEILKKALGG
jgi:transposase-like protein